MIIQKIINKLSGTKKDIAQITLGTAVGQSISFVTLPILTRMYGAEIIGIWTLFNSMALIVKSFSDLGLTNSLMLEDDSNIEVTYKVITTLAAFVSIISSIFISLYLMSSNKYSGFNPFFYFLFSVLMIFTSQQIQVSYTLLNRDKNYDVLMKNPIISNGIFGGLAILFGFFGLIKYGYFVGYMMGQVLTLIHMRYHLPSKMFTFKKRDFYSVLRRNINYIKYQTPSNFISNFRNQVPILLIQSLWGSKVLGYYSVTIKMLQIPINLIANAIGRVFFSTTANMVREKKPIGHYVYSSLQKGMKIGVIPIAILMSSGDYIIRILFGEKWIIAGEFMSLLALQYFFMFLMTTTQGLSITIGKQKYLIIASTAQIIGYVIAAILGKYIFDSIHYGIIFMSTFFIIINIIYFCYLFKEIEISIKKYLKDTIHYIVIIFLIAIAIRIILIMIIEVTLKYT